jgi:hypothetical protein
MPFYKDFRYTEKEDHIIIRAYCGDDVDIVVPETIKEKPVQEISPFAFVPEMDEMQITINDDKKRCTKRIRSIQLPSTILRLDRAFACCFELEEIELPPYAALIEDNFHLCYALKEIRVPEENPHYASRNGVLYSKDGKRLLRCPPGHALNVEDIFDGIEAIAESAFEFCKNLLNVTIPESVSVIEGYAFSNCRNLSHIQLHPNIQMVGDGHFWCCKSLDNVIYFNIDELIPNREFYSCEHLENIDIQCKISSIGENAFCNSALMEFTVPKGTKVIKRSAFMHCFALKTIRIPRSVSRINEGAFINCGKNYLTEEQKADESYAWRGPDAYSTFYVFAGSKADLLCQKKKYAISYL